jgi:hypothetical protein
MLSREHCLRRAERLRISLLITPHRSAARRLRTFVDKYRTLADLAVKNIDSPPSVPPDTQAALRLNEKQFASKS